MYKFITGGIVLMAAAILVAHQYFTPKAEAQKPLPPIQSFHFSYSGTQRFPFQDYCMRNKNGKITVILDEENPYAREEHIVTQKDLDALHDLLEENKVQSWNGFHKSNSHVLDGYSFGMHIKFQDNTSLHASGSNSFPKDFRNTQRQLIDFFEKYRVTKEK